MPRYRFIYLPDDVETFEDLPDDEAACYEAAAIARDLGRKRRRMGNRNAEEILLTCHPALSLGEPKGACNVETHRCRCFCSGRYC